MEGGTVGGWSDGLLVTCSGAAKGLKAEKAETGWGLG